MVGSPCSPRDSQESCPTPQLKASILWHLAFFVVQLSHPYMTTRSYTVLLGEVGGALGLCCGKQSSLVAACRLNCPLACGVLVPRPGIEPEFPALEGEFLTTGSPEKPPCTVVKCQLQRKVVTCEDPPSSKSVEKDTTSTTHFLNTFLSQGLWHK